MFKIVLLLFPSFLFMILVFHLRKLFCSVPCPLFFLLLLFFFFNRKTIFLLCFIFVYFLPLFSFVFFFELSVCLQYFILLSLFLWFLLILYLIPLSFSFLNNFLIFLDLLFSSSSFFSPSSPSFISFVFHPLSLAFSFIISMFVSLSPFFLSPFFCTHFFLYLLFFSISMFS